MTDETSKDGGGVVWGRSTVEKRRIKTPAEIEGELLPLVTTVEGSVKWKAKYRQPPCDKITLVDL